MLILTIFQFLVQAIKSSLQQTNIGVGNHDEVIGSVMDDVTPILSPISNAVDDKTYLKDIDTFYYYYNHIALTQ